jgi:hypothetical protein
VYAPEHADLRRHLVDHRLVGDVATPPSSTYRNLRKLVDGDEDYTFGLSDWHQASEADARAAVAAVCGEEAVRRPPEGPGWIDPDAAVVAIGRHRDRLAELVTTGGRVLLATGHPTGLLMHYAAIARALDDRGVEILTPLDDTRDLMRQQDWKLGVRFLDGVGAAWSGADLVHTHRSGLMEAMLDELGAAKRVPDLVVGDHGMAGAAIERGIPALSIADVNDPALMLAQVRGRTDAVLAIDDNLAPSAFRPVTAAILGALLRPG